MTEPGEIADSGTHDALVRLVRDEGRRVLATLVRHLGDWALAEDAVQEATVRALQTWPRTGVPEQPRAWILLTARRIAVDVIRREAGRDDRERQAQMITTAEQEDDMVPDSVLRDDQLRLIFTCCHPALSVEAQVALSLRTICGFSVTEVARALLVTEPTMQRRLVRARQKIKQAGIAYRVPDDHELPARLQPVAAAVYLIFNEGYAAGDGPDLVRVSLIEEAIRLGRLLVALLPNEASLQGLLGFMLLQHARTPARTAADGTQVLLPDQDRTAWDPGLTREGVVLVGRALRRSPQPDPYAVQAAIAACHNLALDYAGTDWGAVVSWYDVLVTVADSPVVRLNRAVAVAERDGAAAGLAEVDRIPDLTGYVWWHATRAELLHRLGDRAGTAAAYDRALGLSLSDPVRRHLRTRRDVRR